MEEDDMDFTPSPNTSSNLASLFDFTKKPLQGNSSLTYTAPKPPKKEASPAKKQSEEKTKGKIIFSKAVQAYKLENRTYVNQGLIGIVISGNHESRIYEIILYKRTKEHLCQIRISSYFSITLSLNNYASFYDNNKQNWSIMFQSSADVEQFSQKVAICKFYSYPESPTDILIQDLGPASQQKAISSSIVEVTYNTYSLISEELTKLKGDIKEKIKLSDHGFTYFSKGLLGCAENCKRVIIIPHSLSGSWINELGQNKDLLIEVKINKILTEESQELKLSNDEPPESPIDSSAEEASIKARGVSIKEALASTKSQKANLISRMARMGQATLPVKQGLSGAGSDSEEESPVTSSPKPRLPRSRNVVAGSTANSSNAQPQEGSQQLSVYQNDLSWHQAQLNKLGIAYQQLIPVSASPVSSPTTDPNLSVYVSESRIQAAELRMGISKISEKLDLVWNKIQNLGAAGSDNKMHQQALMDSGGILTGIQNLITENERLKEKVEEQKGKIEQQNDRIFHLLELNHKYLEQNSTTHEKQSANESKLKTEVESLQKKEQEMLADNKVATERVKNLEDELAKSEELNKELKRRVEDLSVMAEALKKNLDGNNDEKTKELENLKEKISKASETVIKLKERLKEVVLENENYKSVIKAQKNEIQTGNQEMEEFRSKNKEYEEVVESLKKQISEEKSKNESLSKVLVGLEEEKKGLTEKIERDVSSDEVKNVFPKVLTILKTEFSEEKEYSASHILSTVEKVLNNITCGNLGQEIIENSPAESPKIEQPPAVPAPRTSLQSVEPSEKEKEETELFKEPTKESSPAEEEKNEEEKKETDNQKKKDEVDSRYKSYDQGWRTAKPPPPPLFDDDDDDDDWFN